MIELSRSGFQGLRLGDDRQAVRERFGYATPFRRTEGARESEIFDDYGLEITYSPQNLVAFIQLFRPADPTLSGVELLERPVEEVVSDLAALGIVARQLPDICEGSVLEGFGIGLWVPNETVEAVSIGEEEERRLRDVGLP